MSVQLTKVDKETFEIQWTVVPYCMTCGNRDVFLVSLAHETVKLSGAELAANLDTFESAICGRCGSRGSILEDFVEPS